MYSSHIDRDMLARLKATLPTLIILYVSAGCTGVLQMCDIEFNSWFKRHIASFVGDYVQTQTVRQLANGVAPECVSIETKLEDLKFIFSASISSALVNVPGELVRRSFLRSGVAGSFFVFENIRDKKMLHLLQKKEFDHWKAVKPFGKSSKQATRYADVIGHGLFTAVAEIPAFITPSGKSVEISDPCIIFGDDEDDE